MYIEGDFFGPNASTVTVEASYRNPSLKGLAGKLTAAVNCVVVRPHTRLRCATGPGVGHGHAWALAVGGQAQAPAAAVLTSSYAAPVLTAAAGQTPSGRLATAGGDWVLLTGTNLGPGDPANLANASYSNPALVALGMDLVGDTYQSPSCEVLGHTSARCRSQPGLGYGQAWTFSVGGQTFDGAAAGPGGPATSYARPLVAALAAPGPGAGNLSTAGGDAVVLTGANFGPLGHPSTVAVYYQNPALAGLGGSRFAPACQVTAAHTEVTCTALPGVGRDQAWVLAVGNQTQDSASTAGPTSYVAPVVSGLGMLDAFGDAAPELTMKTDGSQVGGGRELSVDLSIGLPVDLFRWLVRCAPRW